MPPSTRSFNSTESSVLNSEVKFETSRIVVKNLNHIIGEHNDEMTESRTEDETEAVSTSWRDRKRLYPPFRRRGKNVYAQKDKQGQDIIKSSNPENKKPSLLTALEFGESDLQYSSSECCGHNEIPSTCGLDDVPCVGPICGQDNEPCTITRGTNCTLYDVCQDSVSACDDESNYESISDDKLEAHFHMTDNASREDLHEDEDFDTRQEEYVSFGSTKEDESGLEVVSESGLFEDPFLSHRLTIPYKDIPLSRYRVGGSLDDSLETRLLAKRPQSPVRDILEGRFDVYAGISEVLKRAEIHNAKYALRKSKEWIATMMARDSNSSPALGTSAEPLTTFLNVFLDEVKLSLTIAEKENDLSLTLATVWAVTEFIMTETGAEVAQSVTITNFGVVPKSKRSLSHNLTLSISTSFQQNSDIGYPPKGCYNHVLHQVLPWTQLCAAHAEGLPKSYATVRTYIDQVTPGNESRRPRTAYLPDITCVHLKEMPRRQNFGTINFTDSMEGIDQSTNLR